MPNRTEARPAKAALTNATGRLPLLRLFSTPLRQLALLHSTVTYELLGRWRILLFLSEGSEQLYANNPSEIRANSTAFIDLPKLPP
jgi:hypothetical protein